MSKKKIAKFGLTAAVAATTIVAATPADAAAASTTGKAVQQAAQSANALVKYYGSTDLKVSGEFTTAHNSAKKAVANAKAALAKYNGADKSKHEATVASAEEKLTNATRYIDAVNILGGELKTATNALAAEIKAGKVDDDTVINYNKLSAAIKKAEGVIGKVRGDQVRKAFGKSFLLDAKITRETIMYEVSQYQLLKQIDASVKAGQLDKADADFAKLERLKTRAVDIKAAGKKLYPDRTDVYPDLPTIEKQLRDTEKAIRDARGIDTVDFVKAVNATTVEVTFKNEVKGTLQASDYRIEGLEVKNAAVKQSDNKTVVLTTSAQKGGEKYTVKYNSKIAGTFDGISAVVPAKISIVETAIQGVVGKEITLKADIGVKEAGVPVTFNVKSSDLKLGKDHVVEALTDANGIATYSYTQYIAGSNDDVAVYPTGAPATRATAKVFWGADTILTVEADDKKGNSLNNGESKVYKVTLKDAKTGKVVEGKPLNITFKENVDVTVDKLTKATVNGVTPYQLTNGNEEHVEVKTNSKGEATFTVSGTNTKATPIVFVDEAEGNRALNNKLDASELQVTTEQVTFAAQQVSHEITVTRNGDEEAATGLANGKKYKVVVKNKDGKVAAGEVVNIAFNEDIDRNINTNTEAEFVDLANTDLAGERTARVPGAAKHKQISLKLNSKGEGEFVIASATNTKDYATPIVWIDINSHNATEGNLDEGEPTKLADKTYFAATKITSGKLKAYVNTNEVKEGTELKAGDVATFKFTTANQSGKTDATNVTKVEASYTVFNDGSNEITVDGVTVSPGRNYTKTVTTTLPAGAGATLPENKIAVEAVNNKSASVTVEVNGNAVVDGKTVALGKATTKLSFAGTNEVGQIYTGTVDNIDIYKQEVTFKGITKEVSYKDATVFNFNGNDVGKAYFEQLVNLNKGKIIVTAEKGKDSAAYTKFTIVSGADVTTPPPTAPTLTSATVQGGTNVTIPAVPADTTAYLAPAGTTTFTANGTTITTAAAGATQIVAPTNQGAYQLFLVDASNRSAASTGTITVDNTAPTVTSAVFTDATHVKVTFSEAVNVTAADFTDGKTSAPGTFTVGSVAGSGTNTVTLTVTGNPVIATTVTGSVDIAATVKDLAGNALTTVDDQAITSGF
ncbi:hypothetical protein [Metabacillus fastidiosus]|uniref:hypothetical protein n=1 Tax=Metabacillus fastidiosus TaxID=1458 RepID=UPI003D2DCC55